MSSGVLWCPVPHGHQVCSRPGYDRWTWRHGHVGNTWKKGHKLAQFMSLNTLNFLFWRLFVGYEVQRSSAVKFKLFNCWSKKFQVVYYLALKMWFHAAPSWKLASVRLVLQLAHAWLFFCPVDVMLLLNGAARLLRMNVLFNNYCTQDPFDSDILVYFQKICKSVIFQLNISKLIIFAWQSSSRKYVIQFVCVKYVILVQTFKQNNSQLYNCIFTIRRVKLSD